MIETNFQSERFNQLIKALKQAPNSTIPVKTHYNALQNSFNLFQKELEINLQTINCYIKSIKYLTKIQTDMKIHFMLFEGSFLFEMFETRELENYLKNECYVNTYKKANTSIFKISFLLIHNHKTHNEFAVKNKLYLHQPKVVLSKYILNNKKIVSVIDIVELAYAIYHTKILLKRNGEDSQLYEFIYDYGLSCGIEIKNVAIRIQELRNRIEKHEKYLENLLVKYKNAINRELQLIDNIKHESI